MGILRTQAAAADVGIFDIQRFDIQRGGLGEHYLITLVFILLIEICSAPIQARGYSSSSPWIEVDCKFDCATEVTHVERPSRPSLLNR